MDKPVQVLKDGNEKENVGRWVEGKGAGVEGREGEGNVARRV